jgi:hypothetical protein
VPTWASVFWLANSGRRLAMGQLHVWVVALDVGVIGDKPKCRDHGGPCICTRRSRTCATPVTCLRATRYATGFARARIFASRVGKQAMPADCLVPDQPRTISANLNKQEPPEIPVIGFLNAVSPLSAALGGVIQRTRRGVGWERNLAFAFLWCARWEWFSAALPRLIRRYARAIERCTQTASR